MTEEHKLKHLCEGCANGTDDDTWLCVVKREDGNVKCDNCGTKAQCFSTIHDKDLKDMMQ